MATPDPVDIHVGQRIRALRMQRGLTQERLGHALDLTFQQIQKYERGANRVSASRLQAIACVLGVTVSNFFDGLPADGSPPSNEIAGAAGFLATRHGAEVAELWSAMTEHARVTVLEVMRLAAGQNIARAA